MTHVCCPSCRLRFTPAAAAYLDACPTCGGPPQLVSSAAETLGLRLHAHDRFRDELAAAIAVAVPRTHLDADPLAHERADRRGPRETTPAGG